MRIIAHLDLDAFFCSVEVLKNPDLKDKPVVVGGRPEQRGVVAAASYPSRKYGIHSAMPMAQAVSLCKDLVILPPRFSAYKTYSKVVMGLIREVSPYVQQVGIDEAFIDLSTVSKSWKDGEEKARGLQRRIIRDIGLSCSMGIATNKMIAKIASDFEKPAGFTVVKRGEERAFLASLDVQVIPGIGSKTKAKLNRMEVYTVRDLSKVPGRKLESVFGKLGLAMTEWSKGKDDRPVLEEYSIKSVSKERTFPRDLTDPEDINHMLEKLSRGVAERLKNDGLLAGAVQVKVRFADFTTLTRQQSLSDPTDSSRVILQIVEFLVRKIWNPGQPVRLLGVGCSRLSQTPGQLSLL